MLRSLLAGLAVTVLTAGTCYAAASTDNSADKPFDPQKQSTFVQIIVKACHPADTPLTPINQGKRYDDAKSMTDAQRTALYKKLGCVDLPIPMQWVTGTMTAAACQGHAGYLTAMQFLQQRNQNDGLTAVGGWNCIVSNHPINSPVGQ
jgi:hypothetical protein